MKKIARYALIVLFCTAIFLPGLIWQFVPEQARRPFTEKRELARLPEFDKVELSRIPGAFEDWFEDRMPFRNELVFLNSAVQYGIFGQSTVADVVVGKNGWLFYAKEEDGDPVGMMTGEKILPQEKVDQIIANVKKVYEGTKTQNIQLLLIVAPNKERVYADFLPEHLGPLKEGEAYQPEQIVRRLREEVGVTVIYPYEELMAAHEKYPQWDTYYKNDTHWNYIGGYLASRMVVEAAGGGLPELEKVKVKAKFGYQGDLAKMLNLGTEVLSTNYTLLNYSPNTSQCLDVLAAESYTMHTPGADPRRVLVVRDSFYNFMNNVIASQFEQVYVRHRRDYRPEQMTQFKPDIILWEVSERYLDHLCDKILPQ